MAKGKKGSNGLAWHKSGAHTVEGFPKHECMSSKRANDFGSGASGFAGKKGKMNTAHGVVPRLGSKGQLENASKSLGSSVRPFKNTMTDKAPKHISGSGSKHSKDLG
jgi:hypothetical protein